MDFVRPLGIPFPEDTFDHWGWNARSRYDDDFNPNDGQGITPDDQDPSRGFTIKGIREQLKGAVLLYHFDVGGYETKAYILFVKDGKFYAVRGAHCSCYGYEEQWSPEDTQPEHERMFLKGTMKHYEEDSADYLVKMWKALDNFCPPEVMPKEWEE